MASPYAIRLGKFQLVPYLVQFAERLSFRAGHFYHEFYWLQIFLRFWCMNGIERLEFGACSLMNFVLTGEVGTSSLFLGMVFPCSSQKSVKFEPNSLGTGLLLQWRRKSTCHDRKPGLHFYSVIQD